MKEGVFYRFKNGNTFLVESIKNELCKCVVTNRYDIFYIHIKDGNQKIFDDQLIEINRDNNA